MSDSSKTEAPTPKRLRKAREDGDSGISANLAQAIGFVAAIALLPASAAAAADWGASALGEAIRASSPVNAAQRATAATVVVPLLTLAVPVLLATAAAAGVATWVQTGGIVATRRLRLDFARIAPIRGFANLFQWPRAMTVVRSVAIACIVAWLVWRQLRESATDWVNAAGNTGAAGALTGKLTRYLLMTVAWISLAAAGLDLVITRYAWKKRLMMSRDEIKREHKESEGDPEAKAARAQARDDLLQAAELGGLRRARVVVVNPIHIACALRYDEDAGDETPLVVAQARGEAARAIIRAARSLGVPIVRDVPLAHALAKLETGDEIPEVLYEAVAIVLEEASREETD